MDLETFHFRGLHPSVCLGTASDRYAGWIGQIYSPGRYESRISRRTKTLGEKSFVEQVLPVESVAEYFEHFSVLELDFTFYRPLLDEAGKPTANYRALQAYRQHMKESDRLILKAPQAYFARRWWREGKYVENDQYLNAASFTRRFYEPAIEILGPLLAGIVFEQEYQRSQDRTSAAVMAEALEGFFRALPRDDRYHVELRTETFLSDPIFEVLRNHGIGQVLSHWTWLPPLARQFSLAGRRFFNASGTAVVRLMTPRGVRYEEAYARAHPFDRLVEGMLDPPMIEDTVSLMRHAAESGVRIHVVVNNRAGGNAPLIARKIAERFLQRS